MKPKAIVSLSGGLDSAVLLTQIAKEGFDPVCFSFQYGSKHNPYEYEMAVKLAARFASKGLYGIDLSTTIGPHLRSDLLRTGGEIPEGHYQENTMRRTVVPGRNLMFISMLAAAAESMEAQAVFIGVHAGDHAIYPDCRPEFIKAAGDAVLTSTEGRVLLQAPFLHMTKADIVKRGLEIGTPFEFTRTCYKDQLIACGKCGSCQERLEAFELNGARDPIPYLSRGLMPLASAKL